MEELRKEAASGGPGAAAAQKRLDQIEEMKKLTLREVSSRTVINRSKSSPEPSGDEEGNGQTGVSEPASEPASSSSEQPVSSAAVSGEAAPSQDSAVSQSAPAPKQKQQQQQKKPKIDPFQDTDEVSRKTGHSTPLFSRPPPGSPSMILFFSFFSFLLLLLSLL